MIAAVTGLEPGDFVHTLGDAHLYGNHLDQAREQLVRTPGSLPQLLFRRIPLNIDDFTFDDFEIVDYAPQAHIAAPIAV